MSVITMVKEIKEIHPEHIALIKIGGFYKVYGKDAYIISSVFGYKIKKEENIVCCGFPLKTINKVISTLENKKISYIIFDRRDNYSINEKMEYKNLNRYNKEFEKSKVYVNNQIRVENIYEFLMKNCKKEELKKILKEIEEIINAKGKI